MGNDDITTEDEETWKFSLYWGVRQTWHLTLRPGPTISPSYWTLHFDTAPRTLRTFNLIMRRDPRVIRWTVLKMGEKLEDVAKEGEKATKNDHTSISSIVD